MKTLLRSACLGFLAAGIVYSCSKGGGATEAKPAEVAQATEVAQVTPAAAPAADAAAAVPAAAPSAPVALAPGQDLANARGGGRRAKGALDSRLETEHDLSKAAANRPAGDDGHDHADHDHAAEAVPPQDGRSLLPAAQAQKNSGRIELADGSTQVHDLGKLRQGESSGHEFSFESKGEGPLIITGVKPSCGCTKAVIVLLAEDGTRQPYTNGNPIPVGQKFLLESEISTDGKPGGPFNAQVSLYANDPRGVFNVRLTAEIEPVLTITPSQTVFFGRMTTAQTAEQSVTVTSTRGEPFLLNVGQETLQGPLKLELTAKDPDSQGKSNEWTIKVTMGPNAEVGMRSYPINMKSDLLVAHPKYPSPDGTPTTHGFMLNVQAQVTGMVSAEPSFLTFGMVKPGEPIERSLRIDCHDDFKLSADMPVVYEGLQGQEFPYKDAFAVQIEPVEEGKAANLKVRLNGMPADLNGSFGGVMRVQVGHPHMQELQIRFSGVCRPNLPAQSGTAAVSPATQSAPTPK